MSQTTYETVVIDCLNLLHRNWWPRRELKTTKGVHSGLEFGFLSGLLNIIKKYPIATIFLAWDGQPTRCRTIFPEYKMQRQPIKERGLEPDWAPRIELLRNLLIDAFYTVYDPDTEADEEIARITWSNNSSNIKTLVFSNDKDIHQLVTSVVHVCPFEKDIEGSDVIYDSFLIQNKWGVAPERIPLLRSLLGAGDSSDGIRGIRRFPTKLAIDFVNQCESIDQLIALMRTGFEDTLTASQKEKIRSLENQELVAHNYKLMELLTQNGQRFSLCPVPTGDLIGIWDLCNKLEFQSLLYRDEWKLLGSWPGVRNESIPVSTSRSPGS